jgi:hypothetical protein
MGLYQRKDLYIFVSSFVYAFFAKHFIKDDRCKNESYGKTRNDNHIMVCSLRCNSICAHAKVSLL